MPYFDFLLNQWKMGKLTNEQVQNAVTKGYITQQQAEEILNTPRAG